MIYDKKIRVDKPTHTFIKRLCSRASPPTKIGALVAELVRKEYYRYYEKGGKKGDSQSD